MKESIVDERRVRAGKAQRSEGPRGARRGAERLYLVGGERGQEPPDVRITEEDRQLVRVWWRSSSRLCLPRC